MTRKDYILIAEALKSARPADDSNNFTAARAHHNDRVSRLMAERLARDNPRFDRERFLKAAGVVN